MKQFLALVVLLAATPWTRAGGVGPLPAGQLFQQTAQGQLYSGKIRAGIDFNLWFDPAGTAPARRLLDTKASFAVPSLTLGATFGHGDTVYVMVQHAYTFNSADQVIYRLNRVTGRRSRVVAMRDLRLQLALGEGFLYQPVKDRLVFSAMRLERASNGQLGQVQHWYSYGPMNGGRAVLTLQR